MNVEANIFSYTFHIRSLKYSPYTLENVPYSIYLNFFCFKIANPGSTCCGSAVTNPASICEHAVQSLGLAQWVKDPLLP